GPAPRRRDRSAPSAGGGAPGRSARPCRRSARSCGACTAAPDGLPAPLRPDGLTLLLGGRRGVAEPGDQRFSPLLLPDTADARGDGRREVAAVQLLRAPAQRAQIRAIDGYADLLRGSGPAVRRARSGSYVCLRHCATRVAQMASRRTSPGFAG